MISEAECISLIGELGDVQKDRLEELTFFYYHIARPYENNHEQERDEWRILAVLSVIEALMSDVDYQDFISWMEKEYLPTRNISNESWKDAVDEYRKKYGFIRKVKEYFKEYFTEEDKKDLLEKFEYLSKSEGEFVSIGEMPKLAKVLYDMRSEFVHEARMRVLCPSGVWSAGIYVKRKPYWVKLSVRRLMDAFERSFVNYWKSVAKSD